MASEKGIGAAAPGAAFRFDFTPLELHKCHTHKDARVRVELRQGDKVLLHSAFTGPDSASGQCCVLPTDTLTCVLRLPSGASSDAKVRDAVNYRAFWTASSVQYRPRDYVLDLNPTRTPQTFAVAIQAVASEASQGAATTLCYGTLDVENLVKQAQPEAQALLEVKLPHSGDGDAAATPPGTDGEPPPVPVVGFEVRCTRLEHNEADQVELPPPPAATTHAPAAADAENSNNQPASASQRSLSESVAALSLRVQALERELRDAHSTAELRSSALDASMQQLASAREAVTKAGEVKTALQEYTSLLESELEALKTEVQGLREAGTKPKSAASDASTSTAEEGGATPAPPAAPSASTGAGVDDAATAALETARAQLADALRQADQARMALEEYRAQAAQQQQQQAARPPDSAAPAEPGNSNGADAASAKDGNTVASPSGDAGVNELRAQLEECRRALASTSAELAVSRADAASAGALASAALAVAAGGHAFALASLATSLASKSARITELESHCEALQAQRNELASLAQEATAAAAAAVAASSSSSSADAVKTSDVAKDNTSSSGSSSKPESSGSGISSEAYKIRIGALEAALEAAMQDKTVAESTAAATNRKLQAALERVAAADAALASNEEELRRARTDAARFEAAAAIREAMHQAAADAEKSTHESDADDGNNQPYDESEDARVALETELHAAKAEAEAARSDARSLAVKLAAARRQISLSACAAADVDGAVATGGTPGKESVTASPKAPGTPASGSRSTADGEASTVSRLHDQLASAETEIATVQAQLASVREENLTLRQSLAQTQAAVIAASETRKDLTRAQARVAVLEADKESLEAKLIEAQADIRAANVAATSAHARASAAAAAAAAARGAADDADDDDEGESVPVAKYRRLEAALDTANRHLAELSERRDRQQAAMSAEFSAQYELRQRAEAAMLDQLASKETSMQQLRDELAQAKQSAADAIAQMEQLREDLKAGSEKAHRALVEKAEGELAETKSQLTAMTASRDELENTLCVHLDQLVAAKVESAEMQAKIIELKAELSLGRRKIERLVQKVTALEVKRFAESMAEVHSSEGEAAGPKEEDPTPAPDLDGGE